MKNILRIEHYIKTKTPPAFKATGGIGENQDFSGDQLFSIALRRTRF